MDEVLIAVRSVSSQTVRVSRAQEQGVGALGVSRQQIGLYNSHAIQIGDGEPYEGEYTVTPSQQAQVLHTGGKTLSKNVVVEPIPKNYGLITYNGFELTVS